MTGKQNPQSGFSLVEIAVVLVIMGLLLGNGLLSLSHMMENASRSETETKLDEIKQTIYGYVITYGRLPCPDINSDGLQDQTSTAGLNPGTGTACDSVTGGVPYSTLGVAVEDAWGRPFIYRVTGHFADSILAAENDATTRMTYTTFCTYDPVTGDLTDNPTELTFAVCSTGDITVTDGDGGNVASNLVAIVLSQGQLDRAGSAYEAENSDGDSNFVSRGFGSVAGQEFDDLLVMISDISLKARVSVSSVQKNLGTEFAP